MAAVGDKLGGRYFVTKVGAKVGPGDFVEVRDAQSNVMHAQLLTREKLAPGDLSALARDVASVPHASSLVLPDEITQSSSGETFAIYGKPPNRGILDDLARFVAANNRDQRLATQRSFLTAFAVVAEEYGRAVGARSAHGLVSAGYLGVKGTGGDLRLELHGFGIDTAARLAGKKERPPPRVDTAALFLTLHELLTKTQSLPEGAALVKWNILYNCARGGDHPALQSASVLGRFLRDMLVEIEQIARSPTRPETTSDPTVKRGEAVSKVPAMPAATASSPGTSAAPPGEGLRAIAAKHRRALIALGALGVVVTIGGIAMSLVDDAPSSMTALSTPTPAHSTQSPAAPTTIACEGEPASPASFEVPEAPTALEGVCTGEASTLRALGFANSVLSSATRGTRRGTPWDTAANVTDRAAVPGTTTRASNATWVAWQPADGGFGLAKLDPSLQPMPLQVVAPSGGTFRGAFLLTASDTSAWVASTLERGGSSTAVAVHLSWGTTTEAPTAVFSLGEGVVDAVIADEGAQVLVRRTMGRQHSFSCITVATSALPVITPPADGDSLRAVPDVALRRTSAVVVDADAVAAVSRGVRVDNGPRVFMVTAGAAADGGCGGNACVTDGAVSLLAFDPGGAVTQQPLLARGRGLELGVSARGEPVAVVNEGARLSLFTRASSEAPTREPTTLQRVSLARLVSCGSDAWLTYTTHNAPTRVAAVPLSCLSRRAASR